MIFNHDVPKIDLSNLRLNTKPTLIISGETIRSLNDLRDLFDMEEILNAFHNGILTQWLDDHFYEREAEALKELSSDDPYCKQKICKILNVSPMLSPEDATELAEKEEKLRKYTNEPEILKNIHKVAFDQKDLVHLIRTGENTIYLCHNTFSIPLSRPNIHYIGIADAAIENPFTKEQYGKSGIIINNIVLPQETDSEMQVYAQEAANDNGYDDFRESHSDFLTEIHNSLKINPIREHISFSRSDFMDCHGFHSRHECRRAGERLIEKTYHEAERYFDTNYTKCIAKTAAEKYGKKISKTMQPMMGALGTYCKKHNKQQEYEKLRELVTNCNRYFLNEFRDEIEVNSDYYELYRLDYFTDQLEIDEHDLRTETGILGMLEWLDPDNFEYSFDGGFEAAEEIENDVNSKASTFFTVAHQKYVDYTDQIESLIETIGSDLPPMQKGETITDYLNKQN